MSDRPNYAISRLDYDLPQELIAQHPLANRTDSRMLHICVSNGTITDRSFSDLPQLLPPETLVILNNSKVIPARVYGKRPVNELGQGGGRVEILFHRFLKDGVCEAVIGSGASQPAGERVELPGGWQCELLEPKALDGIKVRYITPGNRVASITEVLDFLNEHGITPTPPYIKRPAGPEALDPSQTSEDRERYQTVYSSDPGSVAAPTAGLHFSADLIEHLRSRGHILGEVTLHVGLGTFAPVRADDLADHSMHEEAFQLSMELYGYIDGRRMRKEPILAVGTTSLRVLHSLMDTGQRECEFYMDMEEEEGVIKGTTRAFIYPGRGTEASDMLLTNFHLPRSTLLALVYAYGGEDLMRRAYEHAVGEGYRFFSYGDCMLIDRR